MGITRLPLTKVGGGATCAKFLLIKQHSMFSTVRILLLLSLLPRLTNSPGSKCDFDACTACQLNDASWLVDPTGNSDTQVALVKNAEAEEQENACCFEFAKWMPITSGLTDFMKGGFKSSDYRDSHSQRDTATIWNTLLMIFKIIFVAIGLLADILRLIFYKIPLSLFRCCCRVNPSNIPPSKCVVFNGYLYATAHFHGVDSVTYVEDGDDFVDIGTGFEIAPGDVNDVAVCNAHAWGSRFLAFADGIHNCGTKLMIENPIFGSSGTGNDPFTGVHFPIFARKTKVAGLSHACTQVRKSNGTSAPWCERDRDCVRTDLIMIFCCGSEPPKIFEFCLIVHT
jgi:hypothetical protein